MATKLKNNIFFKLGLIFLVVVVLMIPTAMIKGLIKERKSLSEKTLQKIGNKWGKGQEVVGPYLSIPFMTEEKTLASGEKIAPQKEWAHFLPKELNINGEIISEKRYRGIYEVIVYESVLTIKGSFKAPDIKKLKKIDTALFEETVLNVQISDLKGIKEQVQIQWNGALFSFNFWSYAKVFLQKGISTIIPLTASHKEEYAFELTIKLKGSEHLSFSPIGKTTNVSLRSNWDSP